MATLTLNYKSQVGAVSSLVTEVSTFNNVCYQTADVKVAPGGSKFVQLNSSNSFCTILPSGGTITSDTDYVIRIESFTASAGNLNKTRSIGEILVYDFSGGTLLDSYTVVRDSTNSTCGPLLF
jgi:hypothetical protein